MSLPCVLFLMLRRPPGCALFPCATRGCSLGAVAAWLVVSVCEASSGPADEDEGEGEAEAARAVVLLL